MADEDARAAERAWRATPHDLELLTRAVRAARRRAAPDAAPRWERPVHGPIVGPPIGGGEGAWIEALLPDGRTASVAGHRAVDIPAHHAWWLRVGRGVTGSGDLVGALRRAGEPSGLSLEECGDEVLGELVHARRLRWLRVRGLGHGGPTDAGLAALRGLPALEALDLDANVGDAGLEPLAGLERLEVLRVASHEPAGTGAPLAKLRSLRQARLEGAVADDAGLAAVATLPALASLVVRPTRAVTAAGLGALERAQALHDLGLDLRHAATGAQDGLARLWPLARLSQLSVRYDGTLGELPLRGLTGLVNLRHLSLEAGALPTLAPLAELAALETLRLRVGRTPREAGWLAPLRDLPRLVALDLSPTRLGPAAASLASLPPSLRSLDLTSTFVGDDACLALRGHPALERLFLAFTEVGDAGVRALAALPRLRTVGLSHTPATDDAIVDLRLANRALEVLRAR